MFIIWLNPSVGKIIKGILFSDWPPEINTVRPTACSVFPLLVLQEKVPLILLFFLISFLWFYWSRIANWWGVLIAGYQNRQDWAYNNCIFPLQNTYDVPKEKIHVLFLSYIKSSTDQACLGQDGCQWLFFFSSFFISVYWPPFCLAA